MFRRKKKDEAVEPEVAESTAPDVSAEEIAASQEVSAPPAEIERASVAPSTSAVTDIKASGAGKNAPSSARARGNRVQKVGIVSSDKMQKTVVVRVDRLVLHPKYRRYVRRTSKFMAHDDLGSTTGDRVRIVETRPLSAHKRWRVVEIVQKAAK
jgi:small subunit ribosomal protein S17